MRRKVSTLRPSPNEEARIIREELERRRKLRLLQVREQQRSIALQIRREVEQRRRHELRQLEAELREDWERQQREKLLTLQRLYQESLQLLGQGHRSAKENEPDLAAIAQREEENHAKAEERYREALRELKTQRLKEHQRQHKSIIARKKALQAERERSAKVASLPPPPPNPIQNMDSKKHHLVKKSDVSSFAVTHYHMPEDAVERETETEQADAHEEAELEARRLQDLRREAERRRGEQLQRARLRGRQALRREQLMQDRERLLVELEHMQQTDLLRRRQLASQIFQPLHERPDTRDDFQRDLEFAFEDMYTGERRVKGDLVVQLVPEPLPAPSTGDQDQNQELDVTLDETAKSETEITQRDTEQEASSEAEPWRPAPRKALKKLMDRIRSQRSEWIHHPGHDPADSPTVFRDQVPERDTSIETGSLPSEDRRSRPPAQRLQPVVTPAVEAMKQTVKEESLPPDGAASRTQEDEEESVTREHDLERQKQQQVFLLQELEEQKSQLEQMLLEARQERERLKAAAVQEVPMNQSEGSVWEQEVTLAGATAEPVHPAGEVDHARRVREHQQRLLEQNRVHQRSVEAARQHLEEYQRALQLRYSLTSRWLTTPVVAPGPVQPPSEHLPAPPQLPAAASYMCNRPQVSAEVSTRGWDASASPPRPASSPSVSSKFLSDECGIQKPDYAARLSDRIMERVTEHLPERLRPSVNKERPDLSGIPLRPVSDRIGATSHGLTDAAPLDPGLQSGSLSSGEREEDVDRQREELQEVQRRVMEQREAVALQQRLQEEGRQRREVEMEQMKRQKETLQALISTPEQPVSHAPSEVLQAENVGQKRLQLLAALLKAIEESNGGTLSHLEDSEEEPLSHTAPGPPTPAGLHHPPRAPKPPITRIKSGFREVMTEQHELSAIQEVETPVDASHVTGCDERDAPDSDGTLQPASVCSSAEQTADADGRGGASEPWSCLLRGERLLAEAETSPGSSDSDSLLKVISTLSSNSGRGSDLAGPGLYRSPTQSSCGAPRSDRPPSPSTSISTGSYITTDPELNGNAADKLVDFKHHPDVISSPCGSEDSPGLMDSAFSDSSIQRIIDKYTKELDVSLNSTGTMTGGEASNVSSVSDERLVGVSERKLEDGSSAGLLSLAAGSRGRVPGSPGAVIPAPENLSYPEGRDQDSFRPLIGQPTDQSSCMVTDHEDSVLERLLGRPSAHSSLIDHLQRPSSDGGGWDSALGRTIGRLPHQPGSHWLSAGRDFHAGQLMGQVAPELSWLVELAEESQMRPLVGEPDESVNLTGSSGERSRLVLGVSTESSVPSNVTLPPRVSPPSVAELNPPGRTRQNPTSPAGPGSRRPEDSFQPLLAEVTHNQTADPSESFHLPQHSAGFGPGGQTANGDRSRSTHDPSFQSEPSPERLRWEEPGRRSASPALPDSFSLLLISDHHPLESVLVLSPPAKTHGAKLTVRDDEPVLDESQTEVSQRCEDSGPLRDLCAEEVPSEPEAAASDHIPEAAGEKGILEQSEITLVELTDTTLPEQETTVPEQEGHHDELPEGFEEDGQDDPRSTRSESTLTPEDCPTPPVTVLEEQSEPRRGQQEVSEQKRRALIQRSNRRVEQLRARSRCDRRPPSTGRRKVDARGVQTTTCEDGSQAELPPSVTDGHLKKMDKVKICTPEQRKRDLSEMQQRTLRLYEQLEEVKQQRAVRSRQEDYAKNRLKAKEFQKKTLQKLRAKQPSLNVP